MAEETKADKGPVKARVLTDCQYGKPDDVVTLTAKEAKEAESQGFVDSNADAVAYAESLKA